MKLLENDTILLLRRCLSYFLPYKLLIIASFAALGVVALCTAGAAYLVQPALDKIFIEKDRSALMLLPLVLVGCFWVKGWDCSFKNTSCPIAG